MIKFGYLILGLSFIVIGLCYIGSELQVEEINAIIRAKAVAFIIVGFYYGYEGILMIKKGFDQKAKHPN